MRRLGTKNTGAFASRPLLAERQIALFGLLVALAVLAMWAFVPQTAVAAGQESAGLAAGSSFQLKAQADDEYNLSGGGWQLSVHDVYDDEFVGTDDVAQLIGLAVQLNDPGQYARVLTAGTDYSITWFNEDGAELSEAPTAVGSYAVQVTGLGDYSGWLKEDFSIRDHLNLASYVASRTSESFDVWLAGGSASDVKDALLDGLSVQRLDNPAIVLAYGTDYTVGEWYEASEDESGIGDKLDSAPTSPGSYFMMLVGLEGDDAQYSGQLPVFFQIIDAYDIGNYEVDYNAIVAVDTQASSPLTLEGLQVVLSSDASGALTTLDSSSYTIESWYKRVDSEGDGDTQRTLLESAPMLNVTGSYSAKLVGVESQGYTGQVWLDFDVMNTSDLANFQISSNERIAYVSGLPAGVSSIVSRVHLGDVNLFYHTDYLEQAWYARESDGVLTKLDSAPIQPGTYRLVLQGIGQYSGSAAVDFEIWDYNDIAHATVSIDGPVSFTKNHALSMERLLNQGLQMTLKNAAGETRTLTYGESNADYRLTRWRSASEDNYSSGTDVSGIRRAGDYIVTFEAYNDTGMDPSYHGTAQLQVTVIDASGDEAYDLAEANIRLNTTEYEYTGQAIEPKGTWAVRLYGETLAQGVDYDVTYSDNVQPGLAKIIFTGKGDYKNTTSATFRIFVPLSQVTVNVDADDLVYDNVELTPDVTATWNDYTLVEGVDYELSYENNVNACEREDDEKAHVVLTALAGSPFYSETKSETKSVDFIIQRRPVTFVVNDTSKIAGTVDPEFTCTITNLAQGHTVEDFVRFVDSKPSISYARVEEDRDKESAGDKVRIRPDKIIGGPAASNYTTEYGRWNVTYGILSIVASEEDLDDQAAADYVSNLIKNLPDNPTGADRDAIEEAQAAYDKLTDARKGLIDAELVEKLEKAVAALLDLKNATVTLAQTSYVYDGVEKRPEVTVKMGSVELVPNVDYTVSYSNNVNAGTATVAVTGKDNYRGTNTATFAIGSVSIATATVAIAPTSQIYSGKELAPSSVTVTLGSKTLVSGTDYTVSCSNNVNIGTATVTVTGKGNYTGTAKGTFAITAEPVHVTNVFGDTRYGTAAAIAKKAFPSGARAVVVANGFSFADTLAASALAGVLDAPIVTTARDSLPSDTVTAIRQLGATKAYVVGGTAVVSEGVAGQLATLTGNGITRVAGADRYATAYRIYEQGKGSWGDTCIVASGRSFADAASVSPYANAGKAPIFLTDGNVLNAEVQTAIKGFKRVVVVGGTSVVSSGVESTLKSLVGGSNVVRLAGSDRYATSKAVADWLVGNAGFSYDKAAFTSGAEALGGADALAGGVLQGRNKAVLVLTDTATVPKPVSDLAAAQKGKVNSIVYLGGEKAIYASVRTAINRAFGWNADGTSSVAS